MECEIFQALRAVHDWHSGSDANCVPDVALAGCVWGAFAQPEAHLAVMTGTSWELAHYPHTTNSLPMATFEIKIVLGLGEIAWLEQGESGLFLLHALVEELEVELVQVGLDLKEGKERCTIDRA